MTNPTNEIKIYDKSKNQWLCEGGTFSQDESKAKIFNSIVKATDTARRSGIKDKDVGTDWDVVNK